MQSSRNNRVMKFISKIDLSKYIVYIIFVIVTFVFIVSMGSKFFSINNILNILRQTAPISIMAVGMSFVLASGQIDLTVAGVVPLSAAFAAKILIRTNNIFLSVLVVFLFAVVVGLINGLLTTKLNMPAFLVTLGMEVMLKGAAMWITATQSIPIYNELFSKIFGGGSIGRVPVLLLWTLVMLLIGHFLLVYLPFGKKVLATGGSKTAALYAGIKVNKIITQTFIISAICSAIAGLLYAGRMETARYNFGEGETLTVIAAVVLGGTSMSGGSATIIGAIVGSILLGMVNNGLIIAGFDVSQQMILRGFIIILAVAISNISSMKHKS